MKTTSIPNPELVRQKAALIASYTDQKSEQKAAYELDELRELARTLDCEVVDSDMVRLRTTHPDTFLGSGSVSSWKERIVSSGATVVVFNDDLSPRQQHNLEQAWDLQVLDRTEIILAIFAQRARSAEGRIQVEMAQLEHLLPRLAGGWSHLERQRGGIGLRGGAGETQIEVDRRLIRHKISKLKTKLRALERQRSTQRAARQSVPLPTCALVGYTNAGKSTLLNHLTQADVLADNLLFATLDPTSRLFHTKSGRRMILTDTVGFIQHLPAELVDAFSSTLEEVASASMLAIVVDASHPQAAAQLNTVLQTLADMDCTQPAILVLTKIDLVEELLRHEIVSELNSMVNSDPIVVSAVSGEGIPNLRAALEAMAQAAFPGTGGDHRAPVAPVAPAAQPGGPGLAPAI